MPRRSLATLIAIGLGASEALLIYAGANLAFTLQGRPEAVPYVLLLAMASLPPAARALPLGLPRARQTAGVALGLLALGTYIGMRFGNGSWFNGLAWWIAIVGLGTLLRGALLARHESRVRRSLIAGIITLFALWALWALSLAGRTGPPPALRVPVLAYFALVLPLLAIERVETARRRSSAPEGRMLTFSLSSVFTTVVVVAGILALAVALTQAAGLLSGAASSLLLAPIDALARAIAWPFGLLIGAIVSALKPLTIYRRQPPVQGREGTGAPIVPDDTGALTVVVAIGFGLFLVILGLLLLWLLRHQRLTPEDEPVLEDERESLWNWRDFWTRFQRAPTVLPGAEALMGDDPRTRIRRSYRRFLLGAFGQHLVRAPADTPLEFARVVAASRPESAPSVHALTAAYLAARYGATLPDERLAGEADAALRAIDSEWT
jgi:hypothetical protein